MYNVFAVCSYGQLESSENGWVTVMPCAKCIGWKPWQYIHQIISCGKFLCKLSTVTVRYVTRQLSVISV